jgi:hypothetical protein
MNYLDAFAGIGGFALGAYWAGLRFDRHYFSEIDKYAESVYQKRFPDAIPLGDIQKIHLTGVDREVEYGDEQYITMGAVIVSGYHSDLYDELYKGWVRREKNTYTAGALPRTEVLWMKGVDLGLFGGTKDE